MYPNFFRFFAYTAKNLIQKARAAFTQDGLLKYQLKQSNQAYRAGPLIRPAKFLFFGNLGDNVIINGINSFRRLHLFPFQNAFFVA